MLRRYSTIVFFLFVLPMLVPAQEHPQSMESKPAVKELPYEKDITAYVKKSLENPPPENCSIFIGSSTWRLWGQKLEEDFAELKAINRGFGGSTIPDVIRATDRLILPHKPARILFFCGGNDIARSTPPEVVFENFQKFLEKVHTAFPNCQVYFVSVSRAPVREKNWKDTETFNMNVQKFAKELDYLHYINTVDLMNDETGRTREDLYLADRLHLNRKAQEEIWIPTIKEAVIKTEKLPLTLGR